MKSMFTAMLPLVATVVSGTATPLTMLADPKAKCLDGTQAGYYYQSAPKLEDSKKYYSYNSLHIWRAPI